MADPQVDIFKKTIKWEELSPLTVCCSAHTAVLLGGNVYVGGGFEGRSVGDSQDSYRLDVYNITTNQWSPSPITTPYYAFGMTVLDDKLVTAGGITKNKEVVKQVLLLITGQWKDYSEMPTARHSATAVGYHSMLIMVGGGIKLEDEWTIISATELLDTSNGCWYTCNNLPSPHQQLKAAVMNDKLYLLGGVNKDFKPSPQVFVASMDTFLAHQLNWKSASDTPFCYSAAVVMYNNTLLIVGGRQPSDVNSQTNKVCTLNPSTGQWKHLTNIPAARSYPAVVSIDDRIIVIGGVTNKNTEFCSEVWIGVFE